MERPEFHCRECGEVRQSKKALSQHLKWHRKQHSVITAVPNDGRAIVVVQRDVRSEPKSQAVQNEDSPSLASMPVASTSGSSALTDLGVPVENRHISGTANASVNVTRQPEPSMLPTPGSTVGNQPNAGPAVASVKTALETANAERSHRRAERNRRRIAAIVCHLKGMHQRDRTTLSKTTDDLVDNLRQVFGEIELPTEVYVGVVVAAKHFAGLDSPRKPREAARPIRAIHPAPIAIDLLEVRSARRRLFVGRRELTVSEDVAVIPTESTALLPSSESHDIMPVESLEIRHPMQPVEPTPRGGLWVSELMSAGQQPVVELADTSSLLPGRPIARAEVDIPGTVTVVQSRATAPSDERPRLPFSNTNDAAALSSATGTMLTGEESAAEISESESWRLDVWRSFGVREVKPPSPFGYQFSPSVALRPGCGSPALVPAANASSASSDDEPWGPDSPCSPLEFDSHPDCVPQWPHFTDESGNRLVVHSRPWEAALEHWRQVRTAGMIRRRPKRRRHCRPRRADRERHDAAIARIPPVVYDEQSGAWRSLTLSDVVLPSPPAHYEELLRERRLLLLSQKLPKGCRIQPSRAAKRRRSPSRTVDREAPLRRGPGRSSPPPRPKALDNEPDITISVSDADLSQLQ